MFSQIKHIKRGLFYRLGHAPGWDFGALGVPRGSKNYFFMNMVVWHNQNDENDTSHVRNYQRILHTCEELLRILRTSEIINVRNLSILNVMNVRPPKFNEIDHT